MAQNKLSKKNLKALKKAFEKIDKNTKLQDYLSGLKLETTCGGAPLIMEGTFLRKYFYFRSRWQHATIEIAENEKEWRKEKILFTKAKHFSKKKYGDHYASWLRQTEALKLIAKWLSEYEAQYFSMNKKQG